MMQSISSGVVWLHCLLDTGTSRGDCYHLHYVFDSLRRELDSYIEVREKKAGSTRQGCGYSVKGLL